MRSDEAKVLGVLTISEQCSSAELSEATGLDTRRIRPAVATLTSRALLTAIPAGQSIAWALSQRGRSFVKSARGRATLDVPTTPQQAR